MQTSNLSKNWLHKRTVYNDNLKLFFNKDLNKVKTSCAQLNQQAVRIHTY